jgi:hypothetical protein
MGSEPGSFGFVNFIITLPPLPKGASIFGKGLLADVFVSLG